MKGFTLVELVIVIAIVIVLSVVSVPIYRSYVDKAKMTEGYALLATILTAQKAYYSEYGNFYAGTGSKTYDPVLGVDARGNKFFTSFFTFGGNPAGKQNYCGDAGTNMPEDLKKNSNITWLGLQYNITLGSKILETGASGWDFSWY